MKNLIFAMITVLLTGMGQARAEKQLFISTTDVLDLATKDSSLVISVSYPGPNISGLCGVEIRADSLRRDVPIQRLLDAVVIKVLTGEISKVSQTTISMDLMSQTFLGGFQIQTKDGSSLADTIKATLGDNRKVIVLGTTCP